MTQIRKQALFAALLFGNVSLSSLSSLVLDKYLQNSLEASYGYSATLLKSKTKPIHSISFQPVVGIKLPRIKLPRIKLPRIKPPRIKPPRIKPPRIKPPRINLPRINLPRIKPTPVIQDNLPDSPSNDQQLKLWVSNAMPKSKQKPTVQILLNDMSRENANIIEQRLEADLITKIRTKLLTHNSRTQFQVQDLSDQAFQEAEESYYLARDVADQVLASRYKASNGLLTNQDIKDAKLAALQAIQKQRRQKELVLSGTLVLSATTTSTIGAFAVASARASVQGNNDNRNFRTLPRNRNPVY